MISPACRTKASTSTCSRWRSKIERLLEATGVPFRWVAADSVYGVGDIERDLRQAGKGWGIRSRPQPGSRINRLRQCIAVLRLGRYFCQSFTVGHPRSVSAPVSPAGAFFAGMLRRPRGCQCRKPQGSGAAQAALAAGELNAPPARKKVRGLPRWRRGGLLCAPQLRYFKWRHPHVDIPFFNRPSPKPRSPGSRRRRPLPPSNGLAKQIALAENSGNSRAPLRAVRDAYKGGCHV